MIKKIFSIPGLIVFTIILVIAYLGLWMMLRSTVVSGVTNTITEMENEGYRVEHGGLAVTGFPFSINAQSPNVVIRTTPNSAAYDSGNWTIETENLTMRSATLTPLSWSIDHRGKLGVDLRLLDGARSKFDISPANIDSDIGYTLSGQLNFLRANIDQNNVIPRLGAEPAILGMASMKVDIDIQNGTGHVDLGAEDIVMSQQALGLAYSAFGQNISQLSLTGEIENWTVLELEGLENWLQSPAKIKSDDWQLLWGNADIVGSFDIGFKNNLPEGVLRFRVKNIDELLQSLIAMNIMDVGFAAQMTPVIESVATDEDGRKSIEITIRDGVVKYGFFPLFTF